MATLEALDWLDKKENQDLMGTMEWTEALALTEE